MESYCARIVVLEIGAAGAADQQRVAGENAVGEQERVGIVGVARRIQHVETQSLDLDAVAFRHPHGDDIGAAMLAHHRDAMGAVAQRAEPGHVIGVQMGIHRFD